VKSANPVRWGVERGIVVIPKSVTASRIAANKDLFSRVGNDRVSDWWPWNILDVIS
jgi:diketogulonate reductase-like aldo/keto reductase